MPQGPWLRLQQYNTVHETTGTQLEAYKRMEQRKHSWHQVHKFTEKSTGATIARFAWMIDQNDVSWFLLQRRVVRACYNNSLICYSAASN